MSIASPLPPQSALYRAVWRWHFVAGLLVLPFMLNLAITGGLYLFAPEINSILYRSLEDVTVRGDAPLAASALVQKMVEDTQAEVLRITLPSRPDKSVQMLIGTLSGETRTAFVDPYDGRLIGSIPLDGIMETVRKIHSLQYFGFWASCLVEIAAGWAIVLALSGIFLWWPRGRSGGVVTIRGTPKYRTFWRDLHAVTGLLASSVIVFLAVTGMPWSLVWGKYVQQWTTAAGLGRPNHPAAVLPDLQPGQSNTGGHVHGGEARTNLPWALEKTAPPVSAPEAPARTPVTLDQALAIFAGLGLQKPYEVSLPPGPKGTYTAAVHPARVEETRTVYLDQYSGKVLDDIGFSRYGAAAKAIEWGIQVHQGEEYGAANRYIMLAGCIAIVLLTISAPVMWWKRRPKGSLGMPPAAASRPAALGVLAVMAIAGLVYPLTGLTMLAALAFERLYEWTRRAFAGRARVLQ